MKSSTLLNGQIFSVFAKTYTSISTYFTRKSQVVLGIKVMLLLLVLGAGQKSWGQTSFITRWNLATAGSGANQLSFGTETSGTVNYTWQEVSPGSSSGSGSFSGTTLTITGLPTGATIRLNISPTNFQRINIAYGTDKSRLLDVEQWGSTVWTSMVRAFMGCNNLNITATDIPVLTSCTSMQNMFAQCTTLNGPNNINSWNTAVVTDMSQMFYIATAFNQNIGSWNTAAVTDMTRMFAYATVFNQPLGSWNTVAVTNMSWMFDEANAFNQNIGGWNTGAVTDMSWMFKGANAFNQNIGGWNTAAVTNMSYMFQQATAFNQNISSWNTGAVTRMFVMFQLATAFNQNIGSWNTAAVTDMNGMFSAATAFNQNLGSWTLNATVNLGGMLDNSGMDCTNYAATLVGWQANVSCPTGRTLGALGRTYDSTATAARTNLVLATGSGGKGWTITDMGTCIVGGPLPVTFKSITASINTNKTHTVKWFVSNEVNLAGYVIERSGNGVRFDAVGNAAVAGTTAYSFIDVSPLSGVNFYRVKATSANGRVQYSAIVKLSSADVKPAFTIQPNPVVNKTMHINFQKMEGLYSIRVTNKQGATVYTKQITLAAGSQVKDIALGDAVAAGVYDVVLVDAKGKQTAQTIFVQ